MDVFKYIKQEIVDHPANSWAKELEYEPIFSVHRESKIVLISQAPGIKAQMSKKPWNDPSGKRLKQWLQVTEDEFYNPKNFAIIPMDFYFPGKKGRGDAPPRKDFATMWHPSLFEHMKHVQLKLLIGRHAQNFYLPNYKKYTLTHTVKHFKDEYSGIIPLPHPSPLNGFWFRKNPWFETDVLPYLREKISEILGFSN